MDDRLIRGFLPVSNIRFAICQTASLCSEAVRRHQADWMAAWLLSEALTASSLLSVNLKQTEKYTLRWMYPGPVGTILTDTNERGEVRGFPHRLRLLGEVSTLDEALGGEGRLSAITSVPNKVTHTGITAGVFCNIPRDMAHLLSLSFQVESAMTVGLVLPSTEPARVDSAIGVLLQPLPGGNMKTFETLREVVDSPDFRKWLEEGPHGLEKVLHRVTPRGEVFRLLGELAPRFHCECSREKVQSVLRMFEPAEIQDMIEQEGRADVNCHFCAELYTFSRTDLESMLGQYQSGHA